MKDNTHKSSQICKKDILKIFKKFLSLHNILVSLLTSFATTVEVSISKYIELVKKCFFYTVILDIICSRTCYCFLNIIVFILWHLTLNRVFLRKALNSLISHIFFHKYWFIHSFDKCWLKTYFRLWGAQQWTQDNNLFIYPLVPIICLLYLDGLYIANTVHLDNNIFEFIG